MLDYLELVTTGLLVLVIIFVSYKLYRSSSHARENDFVAIASHQLRTPLTIMRGYISMLLGGDFGKIENKRQQAAMTAVYQANERLLRLVDNLLDVSQLEIQKTLRLECATMDIAALIKELVGEMKHKALAKGLEIKTELDKKVSHICADELMLRQVILNLLDNAIKYTQRGTVTVRTFVLANALQVSVEDTGPGLEKKYLSTIFQKFSRPRVEGSDQEGFGLGLYACKLIIDAHKGKIWAQTRAKNFGFKVLFEIPLKH